MATSHNRDEIDPTSEPDLKKIKCNEDCSESQNKDLKVNQASAVKRHTVLVREKIVMQHCPGVDDLDTNDETVRAYYRSLLKKAGCGDSRISNSFTFAFFADLTAEQAKILSGVDEVIQSVRPVYRYC